MVVAKQCWDCKEVKPLEAFCVSRRNEDGLNSMCKACNARRAKRIRDAKPKTPSRVKEPVALVVKSIKIHDPEEARRKHQEGKRLRGIANKAKVDKIKLESGCVDCGYNAHSEAMDLDHLPGFEKHKAVSSMMTKSWSRIEEEIAKCDVVCSNCHRVRTANRRNDKGEASE